LRKHLASLIGVPEDAPVTEVIPRVHRLLASAPSAIVTATLEDAAGVEERPNIPGTTGEQWPNWSLALPATQDQLEKDPLVRVVADEFKPRRVRARNRARQTKTYAMDLE
jgi:4-alpha-glucanotransferase